MLFENTQQISADGKISVRTFPRISVKELRILLFFVFLFFFSSFLKMAFVFRCSFKKGKENLTTANGTRFSQSEWSVSAAAVYH